MTSFLVGMFVMLTFVVVRAYAQSPEDLLANIDLRQGANYENTLFGQRQAQNALLDAQTHFRPMGVSTPFRMPMATLGSVFRGCIINDAHWSGDSPAFGLYDITPSTGEFSPYFIDTADGFMHADWGSAIVGNHYYFITGYSLYGTTIYIRYDFDLESKTYADNMVLPSQNPSYLAWTNTPYDSMTSLAYGLFFTEDGNDLEFCSMDYATLTRKVIRKPEHTYMVMAIDNSNGQLYAIDLEGDLYKVSKATGAETYVGNTGLTPSAYRQAAAIDSEVGKLFWAYILSDHGSGVAEVDLTTANANKQHVFDRLVQFGDFYNIEHGVEGLAPGTCTITCRLTNDSSIYAECIVTVNP